MLPTNDGTTGLSRYHKLAYKLYYSYLQLICVPTMYMYMYKMYPSVPTKHLARAPVPAEHEPGDR